MKVSQISTQNIQKTVSKKVTKPIQQTINTVSNELQSDTFVKTETKKRNPISKFFGRIFIDTILFAGMVGFMLFLRHMKHRK